MRQSDTLIIIADLSVCTSWDLERNIITKKDSIIYIETYAEGEFINQGDQELGRKVYEHSQLDTLNLEDLFLHMQTTGQTSRPFSHADFTIICKQDTLRYYSVGLVNTLKDLNYYLRIKKRLFPDAPLYESFQPETIMTQ